LALANLIDWSVLDKEFAQFFSPDQGISDLYTRLIAGFHYLKHASVCSDEAVVERWVENPYWQTLLCGAFFQYHLLCLRPR
jgi:transposase, IS5 family